MRDDPAPRPPLQLLTLTAGDPQGRRGERHATIIPQYRLTVKLFV
jgi:hypothetical protein